VATSEKRPLDESAVVELVRVTPLDIPARFRRRDVRTDEAARQPAPTLPHGPTPAARPTAPPARTHLKRWRGAYAGWVSRSCELRNRPIKGSTVSALRSALAWFGVRMVATPFLHDSFIHYFTPVYPDANQPCRLLQCLHHVIVFNEASLCRHRKSFLEYYHQSRTHLSLEKDRQNRSRVDDPFCGASNRRRVLSG
jgi:hypothetical protein